MERSRNNKGGSPTGDTCGWCSMIQISALSGRGERPDGNKQTDRQTGRQTNRNNETGGSLTGYTVRQVLSPLVVWCRLDYQGLIS